MTTDYRPIRLTTSLYKIIAKTLATRFKSTLEETIVENQMAFVNNRQITYAILIANAAIDFWRITKVRGFIMKLDIEKAFDTIN
ncbi:LINE-1 retrotransposable element ORF2 protein [Cucumis melo var. makuwa]|uniref:LINE-1 retrotransposable element ORF2 protein n=1 Tax=Cucumis melo var. makuwa TaxID=1194695 RepID=A0A5A7ULV9_CUCMM|nr:LINE-1 retrotransposable element ORF2 protein [Cucumis melo var. makuwa]TYK01524.1 LINE-1 retrotransposable element ORF2 protein [Cucumis melo var. makuwa]